MARAEAMAHSVPGPQLGAGRPKRFLEQPHSRPVAERLELGRSIRDRCRRRDPAIWEAASDRPDPIDVLARSSEGRIENLVPIRYGRMLASPFAFYRGAASIMASDLARHPSPGLTLWACGDAHLLNFGAFATSERKMTFDINDFDETSVAPFEWDVKRLVASFVVASRANRFPHSVARDVAAAAAGAYRKRLAEYAQMPVLDVWYSSLDPIALVERQAKLFDAARGSTRRRSAASPATPARRPASRFGLVSSARGVAASPHVARAGIRRPRWSSPWAVPQGAAAVIVPKAPPASSSGPAV